MTTFPDSPDSDIDLLLACRHHDPFSVLGLHPETNREAVIRTLQPHAARVFLLTDKGRQRRELARIRDEGLFEIRVDDYEAPYPYQFEAQYHNGTSHCFTDPYRFLPLLSEFDRHLFNAGTHYHLYERLGAHPCTADGVTGVVFRVWAPAARRVSVIGNFNTWDGRTHSMRSLGNSGLWELFVPELGTGELYKYEILTQHGALLEKSDPVQFWAEVRPRTASVVTDLNRYQWNDSEWLESRRTVNPYDRPMAIYEVHPGSWRRDPADPDRFLTYRELADSLVPYVKEMGFTHIELMPVMEHPLDESWGYQVTGYFSVTSRYGTPEEFMYLIDICHQNGIGVILDWVPAHFPTDAHSLARFDGTALYEHEDPRQGSHPEWGTHVFNYGRKEVSNYLLSNALFWFDKYHIDGLRVDAVASMLYLDYSRREGEWIPNCYGGRENLEAIEFLRHLNSVVYERHPHALMIAEESTSFYGVSKPADQGGLGFGFKWNMGWMNDTLSYISKDPLYRKYHQNALTFSLLYAFSENFILPISHDEVVHGKRSLLDKMPGDLWQKFANQRLFFLYLWCHPGKKLIFMGSEFGQWSEWYCKVSLDWHLIDQEEKHARLQRFVRDLNGFYQNNQALWEVDSRYDGFRWLDFKDANNSVVAFARFANNPDDHLVCVFNFTPQTHYGYKIGVPHRIPYRPVFSSDAHAYGGSNLHNDAVLDIHPKPSGEAQFHVEVNVPPLGGLILKPINR